MIRHRYIMYDIYQGWIAQYIAQGASQASFLTRPRLNSWYKSKPVRKYVPVFGTVYFYCVSKQN